MKAPKPGQKFRISTPKLSAWGTVTKVSRKTFEFESRAEVSPGKIDVQVLKLPLSEWQHAQTK